MEIDDRTHKMLNMLFGSFDQNGNGYVDHQELLSRCPSSARGRNDKVRSAFELIDQNGDGVISFDELYSYLSGIFTLLYRTVPGTKERVGVSVHELAVATTEQCFIECDVNGDSKLNYQEFSNWFSSFPKPSTFEQVK